jgi:hypothetical protein
MPKVTVYYDWHDGVQVPIWYVINVYQDSLDWTKTNLYIPVETPFELHSFEHFQGEIVGISIFLSDLTISTDQPGYFGIHLPYVRERAKGFGVDPWDIEQFVIQVVDIEELLQSTFIRERVWGAGQ